MKNVKKSILIRCFILLLCLAVIAACSNNGGNNSETETETNTETEATTNDATNTNTSEPESDASDLPEVKLVFNYPVPNPPGPDQQLVEDEINKYLKEKINATVELGPYTFDEYDTRMNTKMAASEVFDVAWSARGWLLNYQPNIDKGAFTELTDEMIEQYAPEARQNIPDKFWPDLIANDGKVYGFPIYQVAARTKSYVIQKRFIDKYGLDVSTINNYKDIEPFLKTLKENEPGITPLGFAQNSWGVFADPDIIGGSGLSVAYYEDDSNYERIDAFEDLENKKDYYDTMHEWYNAGYINQDAAIVGNINDLKGKGNVAVAIEFTSKPGGEVDEMNINGGHEVVYAPIDRSYFTGVAAAMHIVSQTSENPERALMLINLLNTDKYLYNLICYGIEGKHYNKIDENYIELIPDSGYAPNADWVFGNQFNAYLKGNQPLDVWEKTKQLNDDAYVAASYGFHVNEESISSEVANIQVAKDEFMVALETGTVDPDEILPQLIEKLKDSDQEHVDQVIDEQWEAFLKEKGLR